MTGCGSEQSAMDEAWSDFLLSARSHRPTPGRLAADLPFAQVQFVTERAAARVPKEHGNLLRLLTRASMARPTVAIIERLAVLYLYLGATTKSIQILEHGLEHYPHNAFLLTDLSAALLTRLHAEEDGADLARALDAAELAVRLAPKLPAACFTLAAALQRASLSSKARATWREYSALDSVSHWAAEAQARAQELIEPATSTLKAELDTLDHAAVTGQRAKLRRIAHRLPQEVRQHIEEDVLGQWASSVGTAGTFGAASLLAIARSTANELLELNGDRLLVDQLAAIDRVVSGGDPGQLSNLTSGLISYNRARAYYMAHRPEARPLFRQAVCHLRPSGSPLAEWALFYLAVGDYESHRTRIALGRFDAIVQRSTANHYPGLVIRAHWMAGLTHLMEGEPAAGLADYAAAVGFAEKAGATEDAASLHALRAEAFRHLGNLRSAWHELYLGLREVPEIQTPRRLQQILTEGAELCSVANHARAAQDFRDAVLTSASSASEPVGLLAAILQRGDTLLHDGDAAQAEALIERARTLLPQVADAAKRQRLEAELMVLDARLNTNRQPTLSLANRNSALVFYRRNGYHLVLERLYLEDAHAAIAAGHIRRAERDLELGIEDYEHARERAGEEMLRITFFEQGRELFEEMVALATRHRSGAAGAFAYSERARARALLDHFRTSTGLEQAALTGQPSRSTLTAAAVQHALPARTVLVEYFMMKDRLLTWILRSGSLQLVDRPLAVIRIESAIRALRALPATADEEERQRAASQYLFDELVRPTLHGMNPGDVIVFAPDRQLHLVPFSALLDATSKRFLVEDHASTVVPSATVYLAALKRAASSPPTPALTVFCIANPRFRREIAPALPDLPAAEREGREIVQLFPGSELLQREGATSAVLLKRAGYHAIVHIGAHAVIDADDPLLSYLLMAPGNPSDPGLLYAHRLYGCRFPSTRLVVLAACGTAEGLVAGEGVLSLARAWLATGVPTVIASLWQIDDQAAARFFHFFYQALRAGDGPSVALRQTQIKLLSAAGADVRTSSLWGAFQLYGVADAMTDSVRSADTAKPRPPFGARSADSHFRRTPRKEHAHV